MTGVVTRRLALLAFLVACTPAQQKEEIFVRLARQWNDDMRWGRYQIAAESLPPGDAAIFLERVRLAGPDLVIADQDVANITIAGDDAVVVVRLEWYSKRDMIVKGATFRQRWERRDGRWLVVEHRRMDGDRFPLVTEPARLRSDAGVSGS